MFLSVVILTANCSSYIMDGQLKRPLFDALTTVDPLPCHHPLTPTTPTGTPLEHGTIGCIEQIHEIRLPHFSVQGRKHTGKSILVAPDVGAVERAAP